MRVTLFALLAAAAMVAAVPQGRRLPVPASTSTTIATRQSCSRSPFSTEFGLLLTLYRTPWAAQTRLTTSRTAFEVSSNLALATACATLPTANVRAREGC